jgi:carotenoid cleavage dioxygenase
LQGNYAPIALENPGAALTVVAGALPADLRGVFVRNSSNPRYVARGRHHWFDGDGMLHAVQLDGGKATYRNRWVRTEAFLAESEAGTSLWTGVTERPDFTNPRGPLKDTSNTDVVFHAGKLLTTWWLGGKPYRVHLPDLRTEGPAVLGDMMTISAHPKVCPTTGEMVVFDYKPYPPYLTMGVVSKAGELVHKAEIDLPGPRLQHDIAITPKHTVLMDLSMMWDPELLSRGQTRVGFYRDKPTRFGVVPRFGANDDVKWFETSACFMYHTINAWDDGDELVLVGCKIDDPLAFDKTNPARVHAVPTIGFLRLEPRLCMWRLNLATGAVKESILDDTLTEFPRIDNRFLGTKNRYSYNPRLAPRETLLFDAVVRYDLDAGSSVTWEYPKGWFGGEVVFAPRDGGTSAEDDGYLVTFVVEEESGTSEVHVFDARSVEQGPIARLAVPQRVPTGYHAWWVSAAELEAQAPVGALL